jgi:hypothetical protein
VPSRSDLSAEEYRAASGQKSSALPRNHGKVSAVSFRQMTLAAPFLVLGRERRSRSCRPPMGASCPSCAPSRMPQPWRSRSRPPDVIGTHWSRRAEVSVGAAPPDSQLEGPGASATPHITVNLCPLTVAARTARAATPTKGTPATDGLGLSRHQMLVNR